MPRYQQHDGEIVDAIRYRPGHAGHVIHRLSDFGVPCVHLQPTTQAIAVFDPQAVIDIRDPRRDFDSAEAVIYPGDWIVRRNLLYIEIVPNPAFENRYAPIA